jgi:plasmid maintenance system antidote protein VapI
MRQSVAPNMPATSPPIEAIRELLEERGLVEQDLLRQGLSAAELESLASPQSRIDEDLSEKLSAVFGTSPGYWSRFDAQHRAAKANGKPVVTKANAESVLDPKSGNVAMRLPSSLHSRLLALAKMEGISLNQLLVSIVSEGVGKAEQRFGQ